MTPSGYLPPVVVEILGDWDKLKRTLAEVKSALKDLSGARTDVRLGADLTDLRVQLARAKAMIADFRRSQDASVKLTSDADMLSLGTALAEMKAAALADPVRVPVIPSIGLPAWARFGMSPLASAGLALGGLVGGPISSYVRNAERTSLLSALGGGGGGGMSFFGARGPWGGLFGLPRMGSPLSLLFGLTPERVLGLAAGLVGSFGGAVAGGGLLAAGGLATMGVGMGTDMAGIGQAIGDTRQLTQAQNQLNQATSLYGPSSRQAAAAAANFKYVLHGFPAVAQQAVYSAMLTGQAFHQAFNKATGEAEKLGAVILSEVMKAGMKFLPTIGKFAAENMKIIARGMQPILALATHGGLRVFTDLEKLFQANLPMAMHAADEAFRLFLNTIDTAAKATGGFIPAIDRFLTRMNTPSGLRRWDTEIGSLIGMFKTWLSFFYEIGRVILAVFRPAAGAGTKLIAAFAAELKNLADALDKPGMQHKLEGLFNVHMQQTLTLINGLFRAGGPILIAFLNALIPIETSAGKLGLALMAPIKWLSWLIVHVPGLAQVLGTLLVVNKLVKGFQAMLGFFKGLTIVTQVVNYIRDLQVAFLGLDVALDANVIGLVILALVALGAAAYEIYRHWNVIWPAMKKVLADVGSFFITMFRHLVDVFLNFVGAILHGAVDAFGWLPGLGSKLRQAARDFDVFHRSVDNSLSETAIQARNAGLTLAKSFVGTAQAYINGHPIQAHVIASGAGAGYVTGVRAVTGRTVAVTSAAGRYVTRPMLSWIGEGGPEAVLPLTNPGRMRSIVAGMPRGQRAALAGAVGGSGKNFGDIHIHVGSTNATPQQIASALAWQVKVA